jgi:biotin carboxylase
VTTVLFLGASVSQAEAIRQARSLGLRVVAVDADPDAVAFADADVAEHVDFSDVARVVDVARRHAVDGVLAISTDRAVPVAAAVSEQLGLHGIGTRTARLMTDKALMRARLGSEGIPQPPFVVLDGTTSVAAACDAVGLPAVLKPVDSGGQRGIFLIESAQMLAEHLPASLAHSRSGRAILERYVDGGELNGIAVVRRGDARLIVLSDRLRPDGPGFGVGWAHLYPSQLPEPTLERAAEVARDAIQALGLRDGIAFPQLIAGERDVFVVEVAARIPAGQMADLVRLGTGVDLVRIALAQALGDDVPDDLIEPRLNRPIAIRFLTASPGPLPTGRVTAVGGLDEVLSSPGVLEAGLYIQLGETINPVQVDADRRGYVVATGGGARDALALADRAALELRVDTVDED